MRLRRRGTTTPITAMTLMVSFVLVVVLSGTTITSIGIIPSSLFHKAYAQGEPPQPPKPPEPPTTANSVTTASATITWTGAAGDGI